MADHYDKLVIYTASLLQELVQKGRLSRGGFGYDYTDAIEAADLLDDPTFTTPPIHEYVAAAGLIIGFCDMHYIGTDKPPNLSVLLSELAALAPPKETTQ